LEHGRIDDLAGALLHILPYFAETWVSHFQVVKVEIAVIELREVQLVISIERLSANR
jgi:hypothetical protein